MIINNFRKCCENCRYIEGYVNTDFIENCTGDCSVISTIYCDHMEVCKPYIEEMEKEMDKEINKPTED